MRSSGPPSNTRRTRPRPQACAFAAAGNVGFTGTYASPLVVLELRGVEDDGLGEAEEADEGAGVLGVGSPPVHPATKATARAPAARPRRRAERRTVIELTKVASRDAPPLLRPTVKHLRRSRHRKPELSTGGGGCRPVGDEQPAGGLPGFSSYRVGGDRVVYPAGVA